MICMQNGNWLLKVGQRNAVSKLRGRLLDWTAAGCYQQSNHAYQEYRFSQI